MGSTRRAESEKPSFMASGSVKVGQNKVAKSKVPFRFPWQKKGRYAYQDTLLESDNADSPGDKMKHGAAQKAIEEEEDDNPQSDVEADTSNNTCGKTTVGGRLPDYMSGRRDMGLKSYTGESVAGDSHKVGHPHMGGKSYTGGKRLQEYSTVKEELGEESDTEYRAEESDEDPGATGINSPSVHYAKKGKNQKSDGTSKGPSRNGRVIGRKLVMWHRPRMVEKLMLHLQYECHRNNITLPWDKVVDRLSTGSSGSSAMQHLNKLRDILITEGHMVPPLMGKKSVAQDPTIRGYIRDMESHIPTETEVIRWGETVIDRKDNLEIGGVALGSGTYRKGDYVRGTYKAMEKVQKSSGERRNRIPVELRESRPGTDGGLASKPKANNKKRSTRAFSYSSDSPDPAQLDAEEDYDPTLTKKAKFGSRSHRKASKPAGKYKDDSEEEDDENLGQVVEDSMPASINTPKNKRITGHGNGEGLMTPPGTKDRDDRNDARITKLSVPRYWLKKLAAGGNIDPKKYRRMKGARLDHDVEQSEDETEVEAVRVVEFIEDCGNESEAADDFETPTRSRIDGSEPPLGFDTPISQQSRQSISVAEATQELLRSKGYGRPVQKMEAPKFNLNVHSGHRANSPYQSIGHQSMTPIGDSAAGSISNNFNQGFGGSPAHRHSTPVHPMINQAFCNMASSIGTSHDPFRTDGGRFGSGPGGYFGSSHSSPYSAHEDFHSNPYSADDMKASKFDDQISKDFNSFPRTEFPDHPSISSASSMPSSQENSAATASIVHNPNVHDDAAYAALTVPGSYGQYMHDDKAKDEDWSSLYFIA